MPGFKFISSGSSSSVPFIGVGQRNLIADSITATTGTFGSINNKERNSFGINALNSLSYRKSFYELQNDLYTNDTTVYSLSSTTDYNRNTFASSLQFKSSAQGISW